MATHVADIAPRKASAVGRCRVRELICPDIEEPLPRKHTTVERRRCYRYARNLPGTLTVGTKVHQIMCKDIGFGGMRVDMPGRIKFTPDQKVSVRIDLPGRSFEDEFSVRRTNPAPEGTALNLAL